MGTEGVDGASSMFRSWAANKSGDSTEFYRDCFKKQSSSEKSAEEM